MKNTRGEIIRIADDLIRTRGYNAFSYTDISKQLNIKNAAVHYYFPAKSDLGTEVIRFRISDFHQRVQSWDTLPYDQQLVNWITYHQHKKENKCVCILGALAPVYDTLQENMQTELGRFSNIILEWLIDILAKGKQSGIFNYKESPRAKAYLVQSSLLAALLLNKVLDDDVFQAIQNSILMQ